MITLFCICSVLLTFVTIGSFVAMLQTQYKGVPTCVFFSCLIAITFMIITWLAAEKAFELEAVKAGVGQYKVNAEGKVSFQFKVEKTDMVEKKKE